MSMRISRFFKLLVKALCLIVLIVSAYFLYHALNLPLIYPILNIVTIALLVLLIIFSFLALLS